MHYYCARKFLRTDKRAKLLSTYISNVNNEHLRCTPYRNCWMCRLFLTNRLGSINRATLVDQQHRHSPPALSTPHDLSHQRSPRTARARIPPKITSTALIGIAADLCLSQNSTVQLAKSLTRVRCTAPGRNTVIASYRSVTQLFNHLFICVLSTPKLCPLDSTFILCTSIVELLRIVLFCLHKTFVDVKCLKICADDGQGSLKIMIQPLFHLEGSDLLLSNGATIRDTAVENVYIVAAAYGASESFDTVRLLFNSLPLLELHNVFNCPFVFAVDMKMQNLIVGTSSHSSRFCMASTLYSQHTPSSRPEHARTVPEITAAAAAFKIALAVAIARSDTAYTTTNSPQTAKATAERHNRVFSRTSSNPDFLSCRTTPIDYVSKQPNINLRLLFSPPLLHIMTGLMKTLLRWLDSLSPHLCSHFLVALHLRPDDTRGGTTLTGNDSRAGFRNAFVLDDFIVPSHRLEPTSLTPVQLSAYNRHRTQLRRNDLLRKNSDFLDQWTDKTNPSSKSACSAAAAINVAYSVSRRRRTPSTRSAAVNARSAILQHVTDTRLNRSVSDTLSADSSDSDFDAYHDSDAGTLMQSLRDSYAAAEQTIASQRQISPPNVSTRTNITPADVATLNLIAIAKVRQQNQLTHRASRIRFRPSPRLTIHNLSSKPRCTPKKRRRSHSDSTRRRSIHVSTTSDTAAPTTVTDSSRPAKRRRHSSRRAAAKAGALTSAMILKERLLATDAESDDDGGLYIDTLPPTLPQSPTPRPPSPPSQQPQADNENIPPDNNNNTPSTSPTITDSECKITDLTEEDHIFLSQLHISHSIPPMSALQSVFLARVRDWAIQYDNVIVATHSTFPTPDWQHQLHELELATTRVHFLYLLLHPPPPNQRFRDQTTPKMYYLFRLLPYFLSNSPVRVGPASESPFESVHHVERLQREKLTTPRCGIAMLSQPRSKQRYYQRRGGDHNSQNTKRFPLIDSEAGKTVFQQTYKVHVRTEK